MNIAIQGELGSFHAAAARQWFGDDIELLPCASFVEVFHALSTNKADAIITAVENTVYGSINEVYQLIEESNVPIVGEIKLAIAQQLIGLPDAQLQNIREIYSHPVALAQCHKTIERLLPQAKMIEYFDTAAAVGYIKNEGDLSKAAIASNEAAVLHAMNILQADVHDAQHNMTRFLAISPSSSHIAVAPNRTSMVVTTTHEPGALAEVLQVFADNAVNLAKIQSQPIVGEPWNYKFFIVADASSDTLAEAIATIRGSGHTIKLLGTYAAS